VNEEINENESLGNPETEGTGDVERGDSEPVGGKSADSAVLGQKVEGNGGGDTEQEQGRAETDIVVSPLDWSFIKLWNNSLEQIKDRPVEPRDYLWATDLGKPMADVWLRMKGEKPTNPPNARSQRKFSAGNFWEWIVRLILIRAGILQESQEKLSYQYPDLLRVSGKLDFIAGGKPDFEKAKQELENMLLPDEFKLAIDNIVDYFATNYPDGLESKVLEIKSVSAFMFEALEKGHKNLKIHRLQTYHYLKSKDMSRGDVVYICRDDCRMMESPIELNSSVEQEYYDYISKITDYYKRDEMPPLEQPIVFDEDLGKFSKNNQIAWSPYLTKLYGFQDQAEFDEKYKRTAESWNRVLGRLKSEKPMTKNNEEKLAEIKEAGFDIESIKDKLVITSEEEVE
jgi:hypothetical protein